MNIASLRDGDRNIDLDRVEVVSISETRTLETRFGTIAYVADAVIKDESGECKLSLWNDDIKKISLGSFLKLGNGYTNSWRGEVKLNVGRYGTLEVMSKNDSDIGEN